MDLGMDVAAGMEEIVYHKPDISRKELVRSGIRIGQSVVGTMTTTLLLAYSGGYLTLMMTFAAQGTSPVDFINNPYVASEAVKTLIGSFALVLVAPFTALAGGVIYKLKANPEHTKHTKHPVPSLSPPTPKGNHHENIGTRRLRPHPHP